MLQLSLAAQEMAGEEPLQSPAPPQGHSGRGIHTPASGGQGRASRKKASRKRAKAAAAAAAAPQEEVDSGALRERGNTAFQAGEYVQALQCYHRCDDGCMICWLQAGVSGLTKSQQKNNNLLLTHPSPPVL